MPVLDHDGFRVYEAFAVARYVDEAFPGPALQPADAKGRARMTQWVSAFNDYVATSAVRGVLIPRYVLAPRGIQVDDAAIHKAAVQAQKSLQVFDATLATSPFLAGDNLTLADCMLLPVIASGQQLQEADRYTDGLPNLTLWLGRMITRPSFMATVPE
jgi:glutathione S-transferase